MEGHGEGVGCREGVGQIQKGPQEPGGASGICHRLSRKPSLGPGQSLWSDRDSKISQVLCREWRQTDCQAQGEGAGSVWVQLLRSLGEVGLGLGSAGV